MQGRYRPIRHLTGYPSRTLLRHHLLSCLWRPGPGRLLVAGRKPGIPRGRTSMQPCWGGEVGLLLLGVRGLRGALGLLVLVALSLVDGLGYYRLTAVSRLHLGSFLFPGVDGPTRPPAEKGRACWCSAQSTVSESHRAACSCREPTGTNMAPLETGRPAWSKSDDEVLREWLRLPGRLGGAAR